MNKDFFHESGILGTKAGLFIILILVLLVIIVSLSPFVTVGAGKRGVVLNFGAVQPEVLNEGLHFIIPYVQKVVKMDVRIQKSQTDTIASSKDLQEVYSTLALNYHILPHSVNKVYQNIGIYFENRIIDPAVQEVIKAVTAKYNAEKLITKRSAVSAEIKRSLSKRLMRHNIEVDAFSIVDFNFSQQFIDAIEAKQTAEQHALKAKRDLERIKIEAQQKITKAKAEAEALRLQKESITPELIELRQIEASVEAIEKWNGTLPGVTSGTVPFIDVKSYK